MATEMINETEFVCSLYKAKGIVRLIRNVTDELKVDQPMPESVQAAIWAVDDLISKVLHGLEYSSVAVVDIPAGQGK